MHSGHDDAVECGVGLAVATAVEAVADGAPGGGWDRAGAADFGQCGFVVDAVGVVPDHDQQFSRGVRADSEGAGQLGCRSVVEGLKNPVV